MTIDLETAIGIGLVALGITVYAYLRIVQKKSPAEALEEAKEEIDNVTDIVEEGIKDAKEIIKDVEEVQSIVDRVSNSKKE